MIVVVLVCDYTNHFLISSIVKRCRTINIRKNINPDISDKTEYSVNMYIHNITGDRTKSNLLEF